MLLFRAKPAHICPALGFQVYELFIRLYETLANLWRLDYQAMGSVSHARLEFYDVKVSGNLVITRDITAFVFSKQFNRSTRSLSWLNSLTLTYLLSKLSHPCNLETKLKVFPSFQLRIHEAFENFPVGFNSIGLYSPIGEVVNVAVVFISSAYKDRGFSFFFFFFWKQRQPEK